MTAEQIGNASGYIRENGNFFLSKDEDLSFLRSHRTPTVGEKAEKFLRSLAKAYPIAGFEIEVPGRLEHAEKQHRTKFSDGEPVCTTLNLKDWEDRYAFLSYAWAQNEDELLYIVFDYLRDTAGYITGTELQWQQTGYHAGKIKIAPAGWEFLQSGAEGEGSSAFVAMWFSAEVAPAWEQAIFPAIQDAGYMPFRIDKQEHNNRIDDEIIAAIRRCRFLVADFSGNRGGVYYEAGFAGGLGKTVIWTVRHDHLRDVHFDTRQFNHITWATDDLPAFRKALQNRIEATIGKGLLPTSPP